MGAIFAEECFEVALRLVHEGEVGAGEVALIGGAIYGLPDAGEVGGYKAVTPLHESGGVR